MKHRAYGYVVSNNNPRTNVENSGRTKTEIFKRVTVEKAMNPKAEAFTPIADCR